MNRDDIIDILVKLKYCGDSFSTVTTSFIYSFSNDSYEISFERKDGKVISFSIKDQGNEAVA